MSQIGSGSHVPRGRLSGSCLVFSLHDCAASICTTSRRVMLLCRSPINTAILPQWSRLSTGSCSARRRLMTLAIETSCDDTSVAIVEKGVNNDSTVARLHFHKKVTSNNTVFQGVHPLFTLKSHQENLANLVAEAIEHLPKHGGLRRLPDFVSVTRGPGMRSNLFCGLDTAKGLAVAWQVLIPKL